MYLRPDKKEVQNISMESTKSTNQNASRDQSSMTRASVEKKQQANAYYPEIDYLTVEEFDQVPK